MKLNHHAALRAIGATLSAQHTCKEREYWTLPESLQDKPDFYDIRETIPFETLLSGFRDSGFIVYLDKPIVSDTLAAAAPDLLEALKAMVELFGQQYFAGPTTSMPVGIKNKKRDTNGDVDDRD